MSERYEEDLSDVEGFLESVVVRHLDTSELFFAVLHHLLDVMEADGINGVAQEELLSKSVGEENVAMGHVLLVAQRKCELAGITRD